MSKKHCFKSITLSSKIAMGLVFFILIIALLSGCASQKREKKDPFFEKWKIKAEQSKGFSPSARRHVVDLPEKAMEEKARQEGEAPKPEKSLPSGTISLRMSNTELPVLLRTLVRAVNRNVIINDKVSGKVNINIENAPWNQVFEGILNSHGLTYSWEGDIIRILTVEDRQQDIARETQKRELERVEPLITKVVQVSFADSEDLKKNLEKFLTTKADGTTHGSVMVDKHTNALILYATRNDIENMLPLIEELDKPTPQILIEANIVETSRDTARALGIQWGGLYQRDIGSGKTEWVTSGSATTVSDSPGLRTSDLGQSLSGTNRIDPTSGFAVNFPASGTAITGTAMTLGYVIENLGEHVLAVQLSALETEGKLNILSSPSITTLDNQEAVIESGRQIPYQSVTSEGQPETEFKDAVLRLKVTPHVIDDRTIKIEIEINKDEPDFTNLVGGEPPIITKTAKTTVVLFDGQTTVIGGLSKETMTESESGVPWLRNIPILGYLFKGEYKSKEMEEILIFITPYILKERVIDEE